MKQFKEGLDSGKLKFENELSKKLNTKLSLIYEDINRTFIPFYEYTESEKKRLDPLFEKIKLVKENFIKLKNDVNNNL